MPPTAAFLAACLAMAAQLTGLPLAPAPQVVMTATGRAGEHLERRASITDGAVHIAAVTYPGAIYLPPGWQQGDPFDDCLVVHELVHVLQFASGHRYRCVAEMEPLAWAVEGYCLEQRGYDIWQAKGLRPIGIAKEATCG